MMRPSSQVFCLSILVAFFFQLPAALATYPSLSAPVQAERSGNHDVAVIVAVEDYIFLPDVRGAITNGNDWESFFQRSLGVETVHFLSNAQATREGMERFARMAADSAHPDGTLWFVFIGHGAPGPGGEDGLLIGVDTQQDTDSMAARGLPQQDLLDILHGGRQAQTVLVVDACFSGRDGSGEALVEAMPVVPMGHTPGLQASTLVFSAAQATEFAGPLPGADRPAFSYLLLGALRGWAADGSEIRAGDALGFTQRALRGLPGRFQQTPTLAGSPNLVLVRGTGEADPGISDMMRRSGRAATTRTISTVATSEGCETGMIRTADTRDNCCWHGQVWSNNQSRCIGIPMECPSGLVPDSEQQACLPPACTSGQVRAEGGTACCWPGQAWSQLRQECVGVPSSCPTSYEVYEETCLPSRMVSSGITGDVASGTVQGDRYQSFTLAPGFLPDPAIGNGLSGGSVNARQLGSTAHGTCTGHIASSADHHITLQSSFRHLHFRVHADTDTSLVIRGPGGQLYCNDDAVGLDPVVEGSFAAGDYELFVGRVGSDAGEYRLEITEIGTASTGTAGLSSNFEDARLAPGFLPDPHELSGYSGGSNSARNLGRTSHGPCRGDIATNPDHLLVVERPFEYLRIRGYSTGDTSLVIRGPNNALFCNDDAVGLDPQIEGPFPAGTYQIYVGAVGEAASYRLEFTEYRTSSDNPSPTPTTNVTSSFDNLSIAPGFLPDPRTLTGAAGGNNDARPLGSTSHGACVGNIANNPDHLVELTGAFSYLRFRVFSDEDTTLVIRGPNGQYYCNDDSVGLDPQIEDSFSAGTYQVWIGTYSSGSHPDYRLEVSEYRP